MEGSYLQALPGEEEREKEMRQLEQYLRECAEKQIIDFSIRATVNQKKRVVSFYIHPTGKDGDTLDFELLGNSLWTVHDSKDEP